VLISGITITLSPDPGLTQAALAALAAAPSLALGPRAGTRIAAVLETDGAASSERAWALLLSIPGVLQVDLACVFPEQDLDPEPDDLR
jgi:hypothetical protein